MNNSKPAMDADHQNNEPSRTESVTDATQLIVTAPTHPTIISTSAEASPSPSPSLALWDFVPGKRDVICGKDAKHHSGNEWCRSLVAAEMKIYQEEKARGLLDSESAKRDKKNDIVLLAVAKVQKEANRGGFVRMDSEQGRWIQVSQEQAQNKVLEIMQDLMQAKRYQNCTASTNSNAASSGSRATSATSILNQSFLEEYVSKRAAVFQHTNAALYTATAGSINSRTRRKRRRITSTIPSVATIPDTSNNSTAQQHLPQEDLQFQSFLGNMAASMPDDGDAGQQVGNPFEPDPIQRQLAVVEANYLIQPAPQPPPGEEHPASTSQNPPQQAPP